MQRLANNFEIASPTSGQPFWSQILGGVLKTVRHYRRMQEHRQHMIGAPRIWSQLVTAPPCHCRLGCVCKCKRRGAELHDHQMWASGGFNALMVIWWPMPLPITGGVGLQKKIDLGRFGTVSVIAHRSPRSKLDSVEEQSFRYVARK
jgi:hypothetical protein